MLVKLIITFCAICVVPSISSPRGDKKPTVLVAILARNKAHTLPHFLSLLQNLNYPKERITLWIRSDHNSDNTIKILKRWVESVKNEYHRIEMEFEQSAVSYDDENGPAHWTTSRFLHMIHLRESALNFARYIWADYFFTVDCDVFLTNENTLVELINKNVTVVAPMLKSDGLYSNFWYGWTEDYYYLRTDDYKPVVEGEKKGCFVVPMVHSCVLIDLRQYESDYLTYAPERIVNYDGPIDDIITFAISANRSNIELNLCNDNQYGYITVPLEQDDSLAVDYEQLINIKLEMLSENEPLFVNDLLKEYTTLPEKDTLGFDKIYMINLLRRPERRRRMIACFDELGLDVKIVDAVDGKALNESVLRSITFLPGYADPYHKRPMTLGEIGCFLSHYNIWNEVLREGYKSVLVLEDDIKFEPYFRFKVKHLMDEVNSLKEWDLVYFGRKRLQETEEEWVEGTKYLVEAGYSYWTLGYALSSQGARKLLNAQPLSRLLPVDEYLPILFDKHPQTTWKGYFPERNLIALSAAPLLLYPTHYTGDEGYVSDTEDSTIIKDGVIRDDL